MDRGTTDGGRTRPFMRKPTVMDIGIGVLYFFTSNMVIRTMFYIGAERTSFEIATYFLTIIVSALLVHVCAPAFLRLRLFVESNLGIPAVSIMSALGFSLALISMLPVVAASLFYVSGVFFGVSCGWIAVIWASTIRADRPHAGSFCIEPALAVAVATYFLYRCFSTLSPAIAQGFLLALPLVTIACIIRGFSEASNGGGVGESGQALNVLVVIAAVFAFGSSVVVYVAGFEGDLSPLGLNDMALYEVLAIGLMGFCSWVLQRFARQHEALPRWGTAVFDLVIMYVPMFLIGVAMGGSGLPGDSSGALLESNVWVLIIAVFAYDIRDSLFAIKGLAVGVMFEAMCIGQLIAYVCTFSFVPYAPFMLVGLSILYFVAVGLQHARMIALDFSSQSKRGATSAEPTAAEAPSAGQETGADEGMPSEMRAYCQKLAAENGLTPREEEILELIALGRSAKYIADDLTISHNTTRTHIKHVYEKLNIHSKQELLDLVLYGSGLL